MTGSDGKNAIEVMSVASAATAGGAVIDEDEADEAASSNCVDDASSTGTGTGDEGLGDDMRGINYG